MATLDLSERKRRLVNSGIVTAIIGLVIFIMVSLDPPVESPAELVGPPGMQTMTILLVVGLIGGAYLAARAVGAVR
jgi:hypothetical protein